MSKSRFESFIAIGVLIALASIPRPAGAASTTDPTALLDQIALHLRSDHLPRQSAARRQLSELTDPTMISPLRAFVRRPLEPNLLRTFARHLHALIGRRLDEVETDVQSFDEARARVRQLLSELDSASGDPRADLEREMDSLRRDRETLRARLEGQFPELVGLGLALGQPLWVREQEGGGVSEAVARFRECLRRDLLDAVRRAYPVPPDPSSISPYELRYLAPFIDDLRDEDPAGWKPVREALARRGLDEFRELEPEAVRDARELFLQLGDWGAEFLDRWAAEPPDAPSPDALPPEVRACFAAWNRYSFPSGLAEETALDPSHYAELAVGDRLRLITRLEWVGGKRAIPTLARLLEFEPELDLKVEAAASLARLSDPRGASFLRALGLEEAVAIESVSRRVLMLEAIHRRESGEIEGALEDLQQLLRRFTADHRMHYEVGFTALLARRFDLAIEHLLRALEFDPNHALTHYNLACAYALSDRLELAVDSLRNAIRCGFRDRAHMQADPDLRSLRGRNDFENLLKQLEEDSH
ncbi:MAG: tetratricopeptide repeat protein [Planctomycetes bacterium]|nr:tetratricopeptide repeat protein [Planctomycetota bacterium]